MDKITIYDIEFKCPYCGFTNKWFQYETNLFGSRGVSRELVNCDSEDGGCGKEMVLETSIEVKSNLVAYTIPSEVEK